MADLTHDEAVSLTNAIRSNLTATHDMISAAWRGRAWLAMGYETWNTYCDAEIRPAMPSLTREERQARVADMRQDGMSQRAIADALGVSNGTVAADCSEMSSQPAVTTGTDGRTYDLGAARARAEQTNALLESTMNQA